MDLTELRIVVNGVPKPKGSVSAFPIQRKSGKVGTVVVHSAASKHWETLVRDQLPEDTRIAGPVEVVIHFFLPKPKTVDREFPEVYPDIDKLVRATLDALQNGVLDDDKRVCDLDVKKRYEVAGFIGARIWIRQLRSDEVELDEM